MRYFAQNLFIILLISLFIFKIAEAAPNRRKRVVSYTAKLASLSEHPYVVSIWSLKDENFTINGGLLSLDWVVTAYSAMLRLENYTKDSQYYASPGPRDKTAQVAVKSIYNYTTTIDFAKPINDLSLVKLSKPFKESSTVKPVKLPPDKGYYYRSCSEVYAVGSGSMRYEKNQSYYEKTDDMNDERTFYADFEGSIRIVKFDTHAYEDEIYGYIDNPSNLKPMAPQICPNDSGQPLICSSFGSVGGALGGVIASNIVCGYIGQPTPIIHYMTWINKITGLKVPFQSTPEDVNKPSTTGSSDADGKNSGSDRDVSKRDLTISSTGDDASEISMNKMSKTKFSKFIVILCILILCMF